MDEWLSPSKGVVKGGSALPELGQAPRAFKSLPHKRDGPAEKLLQNPLVFQLLEMAETVRVERCRICGGELYRS
jgi:hypothetical protein